MPDLLKTKTEVLKKLIFVFAILCHSVLFAQSLRQYEQRIAEYTQEENYFAALKMVEEALMYGKNTDSLNYLAAQNARKLNAFAKAENYFRLVEGTEFGNSRPEILYELAEILYYEGKYDAAREYYNKYINLEENADQTMRSRSRLEQVKWAKENKLNKNSLVNSKRLESSVNTPQNDFSPFFNKQEFWVSSSGLVSEKSQQKSKNQAHIYSFESNYKSRNFKENQVVDSTIHTAHPCLTADGNQFFYSVCNFEENSTKIQCKIFRKLKTSNGQWSDPHQMPLSVNAPNSSNTQAKAVVISEELTKLYFVSDRQGGKGGTDIYSVLINNDGTCSSAENVMEVNTVFNEYSPFFNAQTNTLFFSSDGHGSYGGQDIFKYSYSGRDSMKVINLGASVNSSYDDLYFVSDAKEKQGYFASNRPGSNYLDEDLKACCYDIYNMTVVPAQIDLLVNTLDSYDSTELNKTKIIVYDVTEKDSIYASLGNDNNGQYKFKIIEGRKYKIIASKEDYLGDTLLVSAQDLISFDPISKNMFLTQKKELHILTFEKTTNVNLKGVKVQVWDTVANYLVSEFINPDSNYFNFQLLRGKNYKIIASKNKYESAQLVLTAKEIANDRIVSRKMFLELTAIAELRKLLPIQMFFDNDMPNPKSESDTTNVLFSQIYQEYLGKKGRYMYEFADRLSEPYKSQSILQIDTFFEQRVKVGAEKLSLFMDKLIIILEEGHSIDIFLKGYASPRAKSEYNQHLSSRRVNSIRNEFDRYHAGQFHEFIKSTNLKIKEIPFGESQSAIDVSDNLEDTRNSIYNLKAAYERRVEILEILKGVDDQGKL